MEQYIIGLFTNMSLLTAVLIGAGVLLCSVEVFVPKIGLTGILGCALVCLGFTSYYIDGFRYKQIISLLSIITCIWIILITVELILEGKGIIKNPNRHKFRTINIDRLFESVIGKEGKAYTNIDRGGTIDVNGKLYYGVSDSFISQGSQVIVVAVEGKHLVVIKK